MQVVEKVDPIDMMEQVTRGSDNRVEFYQQSIVTMDMKVTWKFEYWNWFFHFQTNVPEPFQAKKDTEDKLKEGIPAGLSDSQVNTAKSVLVFF